MTISKFGEIVTGKTPSSRSAEDYGSDTLFITPPDFNRLKFIDNTERKLSSVGKGKLLSKLLPPSSILVTCIGEIGSVRMNKRHAITNQQINSIKVNTERFDPHYIYYLCLNNRSIFIKNANCTVVPLLNKTEFEKIEFEIFSKKGYQQRLAAVLSALDAKIEVNNRTNGELERLAKTLYDYWFVQFDFPDANGNPYKSSGGKMTYDAEVKRDVPDGWQVKQLGDVLETSLGGTPSTENGEYWQNGTINWLNSGEIANFPVVDSELKVTEKGIRDSATEKLPKGTTLLSITRHLRPTVLAIEACANQSVVGIKEKGDIKYFYIYPYLKNEIPRLMVLRTGAQQPHINKDTVDTSLIVIPNDASDVMSFYNSKVGCMYDQIINNARQNQHLSTLRDWLLPMLMNGQVTVK